VISGYAELLEAEIQDRVIQPERAAIADIVTEIVQTRSVLYSTATIAVTIDAPELALRIDPVLLWMLLTNLIDNAIVHSNADESTLSVTVTELSNSREEIRFEIRDSNVPIPDQEVATLRAGEETPLQHGQGIGLWIVYWCVRKIRGEITCAYEGGNVFDSVTNASSGR